MEESWTYLRVVRAVTFTANAIPRGAAHSRRSGLHGSAAGAPAHIAGSRAVAHPPVMCFRAAPLRPMMSDETLSAMLDGTSSPTLTAQILAKNEPQHLRAGTL